MRATGTQLAIKGIHNGLLITVPEEESTEAPAAVLQTIDDRRDFFRGARVAIEVGGRRLGPAELGKLRDALAEREVTLWAILSESRQTRSAAANLGLALRIEQPSPTEDFEDTPLDIELTGEEATFIRRTIRSGHTIRHPGHVIILGDVNPGSEIIAGGNIVVWGKLRGTVHAGAAGDDSAIVCALDLTPTQLRIAGFIAISPERKGRSNPEFAFVRENEIVAEVWGDESRRR